MSKENEVGALWIRTSQKGVKYLSMKINGEFYSALKNGFKTSDKHPDYVIMKNEARNGEARTHSESAADKGQKQEEPPF